MNTKILDTIKEMLGVPLTLDAFDTDILVGINTVVLSLYQLGIIETRIEVTKDTIWSDLLQTHTDLHAAKQYTYLKVRLAFDPPTNSFLVSAIEDQIKELEWRLNVEVDNKIF